MSQEAFIWLGINFTWIFILAFYSMQEMACVSLNKIRLQYNVNQNNRAALWLDYLLHNPSRLFGTTLIGVNLATFASSECSRRFHESIGINPDWSPISQVFLVLILGELAPMFAARRYAEHLAYLGAPLLYYSSKLMAPAIWLLEKISKFFNYLFGGKERNPNLFLSEDELQKILEEQDEDKKSEFNILAANLLKFRSKEAHEVMRPLDSALLIDSNATVGQVRYLVRPDTSEIALFMRQKTNIVGMVTMRDLIGAKDSERLKEFSRLPWYLTEKVKLVQILKQFRINNENVGIVLNKSGQACGILSMDDVMTEIFGKSKKEKSSDTEKSIVIDRTVSGEITLREFNQLFGEKLEGDEDQTLSDYLIHMIGHHPERGETIYVSPFAFTIKETTLLKIVNVRVRTSI